MLCRIELVRGYGWGATPDPIQTQGVAEKRPFSLFWGLCVAVDGAKRGKRGAEGASTFEHG
jgi:hypothetical protein